MNKQQLEDQNKILLQALKNITMNYETLIGELGHRPQQISIQLANEVIKDAEKAAIIAAANAGTINYECSNVNKRRVKAIDLKLLESVNTTVCMDIQQVLVLVSHLLKHKQAIAKYLKTGNQITIEAESNAQQLFMMVNRDIKKVLGIN